MDVTPDEARELDVVPTNPNQYHVLDNSRAFHFHLLEADYANRRYTLLSDGVKYTVAIADYYERLVQQLGLSAGKSQKINLVKAPMPGLVINVLVEAGQAVQKDAPLLILEAMKMENMIKAAGDGTVKAVHAAKGQAVDKGQVLLEFE
ncbi:MAG: acetyl-CoA carboxylase biotin carboxyl carrier protein subunit [Saprospiraceae bacterium]|nr:acetyl-CoA carboxylase biotin carboxyl carrier protein subunit [Saprospiraceae bacterium]